MSVSQPQQTIALASGNSPLPVYVANDLPVGINARFTLSNNTGLRSDDRKDWSFPRGRRQAATSSRWRRCGPAGSASMCR